MKKPPFSATTHQPGTDEKIAAMAQRLANKQPLHHPGDVTFEIGGTVGASRKWLKGDAE
jgi:hypothetical protein